MAKCDLRIELERADRTYTGGDPIRGEVVVEVGAECRCDGLGIELQWRTSGRGNTARGGARSEVLYTGTWYPGETHRYPFELEAAPAPLTYHGELLHVDWYLTATADIPWALDPKAEEALVLVRGADGGPARLDLDPRQAELMDPHRLVRDLLPLVAALFGCVFGCIGLGVAAAGVAVLTAGKTADGVPLTAFGAVFVAVGVAGGWMFLRNKLAERRLGPVETELVPRSLCPGETLEARIRFHPRVRLELNRVTARLVAREVVTSGSGKNSSTRTHELLARDEVLADRQTISAGEEVALECRFELPADAPPAFSAPSNRLEWRVRFHVDIPGWPDWTSEVSFDVV